MTRPEPRREQSADTHRPFEELAVGHALSALEPAEQERFLAHLLGCARCERDVAEHQAVLGQLAHAAPSVEPPPSVLEGIRAAVRAEGGVDRGAASHAVVPDQLAERRARRAVQVKRGHLVTSAAAVVALLLGLGGWNAALQRDNAQTTARFESVAAAVRALESPEARTVRLVTPEGQVAAVAVVDGEQMSLVLDGLAPNDDGTVYVLWGQSRYGDVRAVGTFDVRGPDLDVLHGMRLEQGVGDVVTLMVTHEQGREAPAMTTQPVLASGSVQQT